MPEGNDLTQLGEDDRTVRGHLSTERHRVSHLATPFQEFKFAMLSGSYFCRFTSGITDTERTQNGQLDGEASSNRGEIVTGSAWNAGRLGLY